MDLPLTVMLDEGQTQIKQIITDFFAQATAWRELPEEQRNVAAPPVWLVNGTMGSGKSRIARRAAGQFLVENLDAAVVTSVPLHRLANEQAGLFTEETLHQALIWRGMDQPDPERRDGSKMCLEPELSKAAQDAGASMSPICAVCPSRNECGYRKQRAQKASRLVLPAPAVVGDEIAAGHRHRPPGDHPGPGFVFAPPALYKPNHRWQRPPRTGAGRPKK